MKKFWGLKLRFRNKPDLLNIFGVVAASALTLGAIGAAINDGINQDAQQLYETNLQRAEAATTGEPTALYVVYTGGPGRVQAGLNLLRDNPESLLVISGAAENSTLEMILEGADLEGVDTSRILVMNRAQTTLGNAQELRAALERTGFKSVTIITAADHMARAFQESMAYIPLDVVVRAHPVGEYKDISYAARMAEARKMWCVTNITCSFVFSRDEPLRASPG